MEDLVCVMIDVDKNRDLAREYGVRAIPTMFMLDSEGRNLGKVTRRDAKGFVENIKQLISSDEDE
jgi:thioredoxin-related protein